MKNWDRQLLTLTKLTIFYFKVLERFFFQIMKYKKTLFFILWYKEDFLELLSVVTPYFVVDSIDDTSIMLEVLNVCYTKTRDFRYKHQEQDVCLRKVLKI